MEGQTGRGTFLCLHGLRVRDGRIQLMQLPLASFSGSSGLSNKTIWSLQRNEEIAVSEVLWSRY